MPLKRCSKCGETKPLAEFSKDKSRRDGLDCRCKECCRSYHRRYYEANRDAVLEHVRRYREENRDAVLERDRRYREENRDAERERVRRYYEENREAERESSLRREAEYRTLTSEVATRTGAAWIEAEDAYLMSSSDPATVQAVELGRTYASVVSRRKRLRKKAKASA